MRTVTDATPATNIPYIIYIFHNLVGLFFSSPVLSIRFDNEHSSVGCVCVCVECGRSYKIWYTIRQLEKKKTRTRRI